jgi:hypothetical protein
MGEATFHQGRPVIGRSDWHALGSRRAHVDFALADADRLAAYLGAVGDCDHGPRAVRGHDGNRIAHTLMLGFLDADLDARVEVLPDDAGDRVLIKEATVQLRIAQRHARRVINAEH